MSESGMNGPGLGVNAAATEVDEARKKRYRQEWERTEGAQLCLAFYDAFLKYKEFVATRGGEILRPSGPINNKYDEHTVFQECLRTMENYKRERDETLRRNLEKAQQAARCQHVFLSGKQCGAPRMRGKQLCRMHEGMEEAKAVKLDLGPMEDADSIQVGIRKLQAAIIDGKLDSKQIGQLAYTIQLAAWNVTRTSTRRE